MAKLLLETIRKINFETKPENEGISFRRIKRQKAQFSDFSMKRRMEMKVENRQNWPNIGPNRVSKSTEVFENSEKTS